MIAYVWLTLSLVGYLLYTLAPPPNHIEHEAGWLPRWTGQPHTHLHKQACFLACVHGGGASGDGDRGAVIGTN
jgi:hypothetical protein